MLRPGHLTSALCGPIDIYDANKGKEPKRGSNGSVSQSGQGRALGWQTESWTNSHQKSDGMQK